MDVEYRQIAKSMAKDYASPVFLVDSARIERVQDVRTPTGGVNTQRTMLPGSVRCRVTKGDAMESNKAGRDVTVFSAKILFPPGTDVQMDDRVHVTNSSTNEVRIFEVRGVSISTFEAVRRVLAVEIV